MKRKEDEAKEAETHAAKRTKTLNEQHQLETAMWDEQARAWGAAGFHDWVRQMDEGTDAIWKSIYGEKWREGKKFEEEKLLALQEKAAREKRALETKQQEERDRKKEAEMNLFKPPKVYLDDLDPRY